MRWKSNQDTYFSLEFGNKYFYSLYEKKSAFYLYFLIIFYCREIASAIKKLLDAVNEVSAYIPGTSGKQALDQKKREFVKYSKRFSNTLKEFFRDGQ